MDAAPESVDALAAGASGALVFGSTERLSAEAVLFLFVGLLLGGALGVAGLILSKLRWGEKSEAGGDAAREGLSRRYNVRGVGGESADERCVRSGKAPSGFQLRHTLALRIFPREA